MRTRNFDLNPCLFPMEIVVGRLRAYIRHRFGTPVPPKKGRAARARRARLLTSKPWKRFS